MSEREKDPPGIIQTPRWTGIPEYDWTKCICPKELRSLAVYGPMEGLDPEACCPGASHECDPKCVPCQESYQDWLSGPGDW